MYIGALEVGISPTLMAITTSYYRRQEMPVRNSFWQSSFGTGVIVLSLVAYGLGHADSSVAQWKLVFLVSTQPSTGIRMLTNSFRSVRWPDNRGMGSPISARCTKQSNRSLVAEPSRETGRYPPDFFQ